MLKFYEDVRIKDDHYPWNGESAPETSKFVRRLTFPSSVIFGKLSNAAISRMYRDLRCQYHLVQSEPNEVPHIPALTPSGFERWMTTMIEAHPDQEFNRLKEAVLNMPISNADDGRERFPKELSRRLLPKHGNLQAQQHCAVAIGADPMVQLPKLPSFPPPPPTSPTNPASSLPKLERERMPYGHSRSSPVNVPASEDDRSTASTSIPIERERKPYSAQPGGGKVHSDNFGSSKAEGSRVRSDSNASRTSWSSGPVRPSDHGTSGSVSGSGARLHRHNSGTKARRPRSPPYNTAGPSTNNNGNSNSNNNGYSRSDNSVGDIPAGYNESNLYGGGSVDDEWRSSQGGPDPRRNDWSRRQAEDDDRYGRSGGYDDEHWNSRRATFAGYGAPPSGSYPGAYGYPPPPPKH